MIVQADTVMDRELMWGRGKEERAMDLLESHLGPAQLKTWRHSRYFGVTGSDGGRYCICGTGRTSRRARSRGRYLPG
jgi:hypothetical protein